MYAYVWLGIVTALVVLLAASQFAIYVQIARMFTSTRDGLANHGPSIGDSLSPKPALSTSGALVHIPERSSRASLVLFMAEACKACQELLPLVPGVAALHAGVATQLLVHVDSESHRPALPWPLGQERALVVVADARSRLAAGFGVGITPFMVAARDGRVVSKGIVNSLQDLVTAYESIGAIARPEPSPPSAPHAPVGQGEFVR